MALRRLALALGLTSCALALSGCQRDKPSKDAEKKDDGKTVATSETPGAARPGVISFSSAHGLAGWPHFTLKKGGRSARDSNI